MKKRAISLLLALCLCIALLPTTALAAGNPYPNYNYYNSASDYQIACTWYAWQQAYDRQGIALPIWGNGGDWFNSASGSGYSTGSTPTVGAIACWSATNTPPYGHVAYVTGVNGDGSFSLIEGGSGWSGASAHGVCSRTISHGLYWPDQGFIYLGSSGNSSPAVAFSPWSKNGYTYIGETDAAIGQLITVSNGNCTETGMYLYNANGQQVASGKNGSYDVPQIFFKINEECGYTLTPGTTYKYKFYAVVNGKTYWSDEQSFKTTGTAPAVKPTVTFKTWENTNYTYVRETDAAIGQEILVSNGTCGENGIYLYDTNENFLASGKDDSYTYPKIYFKVNDECNYTLKPGTTYKYKFYAVVNGEYYWSDWGTFKTTGTAPSANYSISLNRSSLSLTVGDKAALSATVSPTGPVVTWKSSDESVVKVANGNVTAVKAGSATITATVAGKTATCAVTVTAVASTPEPTPDPGSGSSREQEPNDTIVTANEIKLDTEISGITSKTRDKDWFKFTLPSKGSIAISFKHDYFDSSFNHWRTSIYTAENEEITSVAWKGNDTVEKESGRLGLDAGTYFLCVEGADSEIRDNAYQAVIEFTQSENWEAEFNNTIVTADSISSNQTYYGSIMQSGDKDWYQFTLPTSGPVQVSFGHEYIDTSFNGWRTSIYTADNKKVDSASWKGNSTVTGVFEAADLPAGDYYLCVEGTNDKSYGPSYWFSVQPNADDSSGAEGIIAPFTDVKANAYYAEPVKWAVNKGVTLGTSATTFSPNATCTNAQILTFIWRAAGSPTPSLANPFTNLSGDEYYAKAAVWAYSMGMVSGTTFDANKACTRAMTVEYLWKQAGSPATAANGKFTDVPSGAAYAPAVVWAVSNGITVGTSGTTFSPDNICTRGQIMTFLYRAETREPL